MPLHQLRDSFIFIFTDDDFLLKGRKNLSAILKTRDDGHSGSGKCGIDMNLGTWT
jgi:hypothetical protein